MALGVTALYAYGPIAYADRYEHLLTIAFDSSYPTGGEPLAKTDMGFAATPDPEFDVRIAPKGGYVFEYDHANATVIAYSGALAQVANLTDLSALTGVRVLVHGHFPL